MGKVKKDNSRKLAYVLIFSLAWSFNILFNKLGLNQGAEPIAWTVQTAFVSALILTGYMLLGRSSEFAKLDQKIIVKFLFMGIFVAIAYIAGIYGLRYSTSINYSFLIKSSLIFTVTLAYFLLKEPLSRYKLALLLAFVVGAYLITTNGQLIFPQKGDLLTLLASLCFSYVVILQKNLNNRIDPDMVSWARIVFALVFVVLVVPFVRADPFRVVAPINLLLAGLFNALLALYMNKTISVSSASYMSMMSMVVPVISLVLGLLLLKEAFGIWQAVGGAVIILSGVLVQKLKI